MASFHSTCRRGVRPFVMVCVAVAAIVAASAAGRDWIAPPTKDFPLTGGDYWHRRYSALDQINTSNVKKLGGAWMIRLEEGRPGGQLQGTPVVTGGVMYVTTGTRNALARTTND